MRPAGRLRAAAALAAGLLAPGVLTGCAGHDRLADTGGSTRYISGSGVTTWPAGRRSAAPELSGPTLSGGSWRLSGAAGDVVVVNFWASWCSPCRSEAAGLAQVAARTRAAGVRFVGINVKDSAGNARAFVADHPSGYPSLVDRYGSRSASFGISAQALPTTVILDRRHDVAISVAGEAQYTTLLALVRRVTRERG